MRSFSWREWQCYSNQRCLMSCIWLVSHVVDIRHLHVDASVLHVAFFGTLLRSLPNLETLCIKNMGQAYLDRMTDALVQSQAPISAFSFSGCCEPGWLPPSTQLLVLGPLKLGAAPFNTWDIPGLLSRVHQQVPGLRKLHVLLSGSDSAAGPHVDDGTGTAC